LGGILGAYSVFVLVIVFWPTPVDRPLQGTITVVLENLHKAGVPRQVDYTFVEVAANVALFIPIGVLVALLVMPALWWVAIVYGLTFSLVIEFVQSVFLPQRFASVGDLLSNSAGALIGGLIGTGIRWIYSAQKLPDCTAVEV